jgi:streptogramin lyase
MKTKTVASLALILATSSAFAQTSSQWQDHYYSTPTTSSSPWNLVRGPDGNIWFTEYGANNIGKLDPTTGQIQEFIVPTAGSGPLGLVFGPDGNLWFTEQQGNNIGRFTLATGLFDEFPIPTVNAYPFSIAVGSDGSLYFTESSPDLNAKVGKITMAGDITEIDLSDGQADPTGITRGSDGNIWFAQQFPYDCSADPTPPVARFGTMSASGTVSEFDLPPCHYPLNVASGSDGNLWFTEQVNGQIGTITTGGTVTEFDIPGVGVYSSPTAITASADGNIYFSENMGNTIDVVSPTGAISIAKQLTLAQANVNGMVEGPNPFGSGTAIWFTANDSIGVMYLDANGTSGAGTDNIFDATFDGSND